MVNTMNAATSFTNFQLHLGRSLCIMPLIVPNILSDNLRDAGETATLVIQHLKDDVVKAQDNLLLTKITQAHHTSSARAPEHTYVPGDLVMLSTANCRHKYKKKGEKRSAKFFLQWDGPYRVTKAHPEASSYTLDIMTDTYLVYHTQHLKPHHANDDKLFPSQRLEQPGPILTPERLEEYSIQEIIDSHQHGQGWQFLVCWLRYGPQHNLWVAASELNECEALNIWYTLGGDGPDAW
jgi:hypothetical protein